MIKLEFKKVEIIAKLLIDAIEKVNIKLGVLKKSYPKRKSYFLLKYKSNKRRIVILEESIKVKEGCSSRFKILVVREVC